MGCLGHIRERPIEDEVETYQQFLARQLGGSVFFRKRGLGFTFAGSHIGKFSLLWRKILGGRKSEVPAKLGFILSFQRRKKKLFAPAV